MVIMIFREGIVKFKDLALNVWAHLPLLALTDDYWFFAGPSKENNHEYRFSLINLFFGELQLQLITLSLRRGCVCFRLWRTSRMSEMDRFSISETKMDSLLNEYGEHYRELTDDDKDIEKQALARKLGDSQARINSSIAKINIYTSIILVTIPLIVSLNDWRLIGNFSLFKKVMLLSEVYAITNLCACIFQSLSVRKSVSSSFRDLKKAQNKSEELAKQLYFDWQNNNKKADMFVSFVSCIQEWVIATLVIFVGICASVTMNRPMDSRSTNEAVYTFCADNIGKRYDSSAVSWQKIKYELEADHFSRVIVLYNSADVAALQDELASFSHQTITWIYDSTLEEDIVKLIFEVK